MKQFVLITVLIMSLNAGDLFTELTFGYQAVEQAKIFGSEPLENVVGGDSTRTELLIGMRSSKVKSSGRRSGGSAFGYGWINDEKKNNELGLGLGMKIESETTDYLLFLSGKSGVGVQYVKGKRFHLDTNTNFIGYVFGGPVQEGDFIGKYADDTYVVDIELEIGGNLKLTEALSIVSSISYLAQWYSFSYSIEGGGSLSLSGYPQDSYVGRVGLNYRF